MSNIGLNNASLGRWFRDRGDYTHNITYNLNEDSVIMDFGGYTGVWAQQMIDKYNPNVYIIEPIPSLFDGMCEKFKNNPKVHLLNVGVGPEKKKEKIFLHDDGSSFLVKGKESITVELNTIEDILVKCGLEEVDLLQINIEGYEYSLLESMIRTKSINRFKNIQVQFHLGVDGDVERRNAIQKGFIENGFKNKFEYPFVWESWFRN